ncbi:MAG: hypothetical protein P9L92_03795 [Candidatus Electryonea clarkiae]|nr:hypothetical protein [Candidatus Electryonea clarkiae]MDP8286939.1 hypothetical protein [Candidatus Electryonea clarkiae]
MKDQNHVAFDKRPEGSKSCSLEKEDPKGRNHVARGVSPGSADEHLFSPAGTEENQ